uniref:Putative secreted protein n=1 Tax=Amblyomma triste TaxID=251400 RepID=A0A023G3Y9_AMBTT
MKRYHGAFLIFLMACRHINTSEASACSSDEVKAKCTGNEYPENICPDIQRKRRCSPGEDVCVCPNDKWRQPGTHNCVYYDRCCGGRMCGGGHCPKACG